MLRAGRGRAAVVVLHHLHHVRHVRHHLPHHFAAIAVGAMRTLRLTRPRGIAMLRMSLRRLYCSGGLIVPMGRGPGLGQGRGRKADDDSRGEQQGWALHGALL
jgi:hypothetical protein